jgi:hypothetical protein
MLLRATVKMMRVLDNQKDTLFSTVIPVALVLKWVIDCWGRRDDMLQLFTSSFIVVRQLAV